jgi:hypothetical protein
MIAIKQKPIALKLMVSAKLLYPESETRDLA